jgi:hypothetical protein
MSGPLRPWERQTPTPTLSEPVPLLSKATMAHSMSGQRPACRASIADGTRGPRG